MKIINKAKKTIIKLDDFREEKLEIFIVNDILKVLDNNPTVDKIEKQAYITAITAASAYASTYGLPACPGNIKEKIADELVKATGKANKLLQKQLNKKSKAYVKRHPEEV